MRPPSRTAPQSSLGNKAWLTEGICLIRCVGEHASWDHTWQAHGIGCHEGSKYLRYSHVSLHLTASVTHERERGTLCAQPGIPTVEVELVKPTLQSHLRKHAWVSNEQSTEIQYCTWWKLPFSFFFSETRSYLLSWNSLCSLPSVRILGICHHTWENIFSFNSWSHCVVTWRSLSCVTKFLKVHYVYTGLRHSLGKHH